MLLWPRWSVRLLSGAADTFKYAARCANSNPHKAGMTETEVSVYRGFTFLSDCPVRPESVLDWPVVEKAVSPDGEVADAGMVHYAIPDLGAVDLNGVDVVLLSSHESLAALPYITEYSDFKGKVFATQPTIEFGRQQLVEIAEGSMAGGSKEGCAEHNDTHLRRPVYSVGDVHSCFSKVTPLMLTEIKRVSQALTVTPVASGYSIGGCNWVIQSPFEKVVLLGASSHPSHHRHPDPLNTAPLLNADLVIVSRLSPSQDLPPPAAVEAICAQVGSVVAAGGSVLFPCQPTGVVYDILDGLLPLMETVGQGRLPILFVSPVADMSVAYSNISGEYLNRERQDRLLSADPPFLHGTQQSAGGTGGSILRQYPHAHAVAARDLKLTNPCVVIAGHPSLRCGEAPFFLRHFAKKPANMIVFTDPDYPMEECLKPYGGKVDCRTVSIPVDGRLTVAEANLILKEIKPKRLVVAGDYAPSDPRGVGLNAIDGPTTAVDCGDVAATPLQCSAEMGTISAEMIAECGAAKAAGVDSRGGVHVRGWLRAGARGLELHPVSKAEEKSHQVNVKRHLFGSPTVESVVNSLKKRGFTDIKVTDCSLHGQPAREVSCGVVRGSIVVGVTRTELRCSDEGAREVLFSAVRDHLTELA